MLGQFSDITEAVNFTFVFILVISVVLLAFITALMVTFVIRYHHKRNPVAAHVEGHTMLEIVWTVIPTILALGMFYYGWKGYKLMVTVPPNAMEVSATGRMWSWQFEYENGKQSPELYVPQGKPVKVNISSADVIHSFYVPAFKVKQDAVPGLDTYVWFSPADTGEFDIFCAEYCGDRHAFMLSKVNVISEAEFEEWVQKDVSIAEPIDENVGETERVARLVSMGERLSQLKGCNACHSADGSRLVGPTYKGLFGKTETVLTDGDPREIVVDEAYIRKSMLEPMADVVEGYQPLMPSQDGMLNETEIEALTQYIKSLK